MDIITTLRETPLPTILVIGGIVFLLLAIVTNINGKISVSRRQQKTSGIIGAILVILGIALYFAPGEIIDSQSTPTQTTNAPLLDSVLIREDESQGYLILIQEISYSDEEGDAYWVDWILVDSTKPGESVVDGSIEDSVTRQQEGGVLKAEWHCTGGEYSVIVRAIVLDRAGNESEPFEYSLKCR